MQSKRPEDRPATIDEVADAAERLAEKVLSRFEAQPASEYVGYDDESEASEPPREYEAGPVDFDHAETQWGGDRYGGYPLRTEVAKPDLLWRLKEAWKLYRQDRAIYRHFMAGMK